MRTKTKQEPLIRSKTAVEAARCTRRPRAAVYSRSANHHLGGPSLSDQVIKCRRYAEERGFRVEDAHIYRDVAISGMRGNRPALTTMRNAAGNGMFDVVLVVGHSRLSRNVNRLFAVLADFEVVGVKVICIDAQADPFAGRDRR